MATWDTRAYALLHGSIGPPSHELNELDWKTSLSPDKRRLTEHIIAFANYPGGGFFAFGVGHAGNAAGVGTADAERIISQISNLARDAIEPPVAIEHEFADYLGSRVLFIRIPESSTKPVVPRGKDLGSSFIRSGGSTRAASRQEIGTLLLGSRTPNWEELRATVRLSDEELLSRLNFKPIFEMLGRTPPGSQGELMEWAAAEKFIERDPKEGGYVTNLGVLSVAQRLDQFPDLVRKAVRVVIYNGTDKSDRRLEQEGVKGYAISFQDLLDFVMSHLPQSDVIERALSVKRTVYPEIALREIIANALIHQDFSITGAGPMIELFSDRIVVSNPGSLLPGKQLDRLIGAQPESRNALLARSFRRFKICEELGSGLVKAGQLVELFGLPPIKFETGEKYFRVTIFSPRSYADMTANERLEACYQHAVLQHVSRKAMTNKSLRERLGMPEKHRAMVSLLLQQAVESELIKPADPQNKSKKMTEYQPWWA